MTAISFSDRTSPGDWPAAGAGRPGAGRGPARALRVLIAEDQEVNRLLISTLVERAGHRPVLAANGAEAVEAVRAGGIDAILMDLHMPVMDGVSATRAIRAMTGAPQSMPIVAVTADTVSYSRAQLQAEGFDGMLAKPLVIAELKAFLDGGKAGQARDDRAAAASGPVLLDPALFDRLWSDLGADLGRRVVAGFLEEAENRVADLCGEDDPALVAGGLAALADSAQDMGAAALARAARELAAGPLDDPGRRTLCRYMAATRAALESAIAERVG